ncbi:MAG: adenylate/guanylate cyclase domain-containing protein [Magnetococcales bacterium]|nr:adenylate/guanylate cyclase domain-containing protein [Magnetococcales bacterium]
MKKCNLKSNPFYCPSKRVSIIGPVSISVTLAVAISVLVLASSLTLFFTMFRANQENTFTLLNRSISLLSRTLETDLRNYINPFKHHMEGLVWRVRDGQLDITNKKQLHSAFVGVLTTTPNIHGLFSWRKGLVPSGVVRKDNRFVDIVPKDEDRPQIQVLVEKYAVATEPSWDELTLTSGQSFILYNYPVIKDGKLLGVLGLSISVPELSKVVALIGNSVGGNGFLLNGKNSVLAHGLRMDREENGLTIPLDEIEDQVLSELWEGDDPATKSHHVKVEPGLLVRHIEINDRHYLAVMREINDYGKKTWYAGAWFPADEIGGASLHRLVLSAIGGAIIIIVGVLCAIFLGRLISKPIAGSANAQAQIGQLDLQHIEPLPDSFFKELNEQAVAFNTMLEALRAFERYVPRKLVTALMQKNLVVDTLSQERELTVMFTDIAGFTTLSESMTAQEVADFLNEHFAILGACVEEQGATIDKYIGDALMAFWGAPEIQSDSPVRACLSALAIAKNWDIYNKKRVDSGLPEISIRIGLHTGPAVVGNIGFPGRINYTIVGDTVNTCQRLESLGREIENSSTTTILISQAVRDKLDDSFTCNKVGSYQVKGKNEPVVAYQLLSKK